MTGALLSRQTTVSGRYSDITGVILVGGRSHRMGQDKAFLPIGGVPVVERVLTALQGCFDHLLLVGDRGERFEGYTVPVLPDIYPGSSLGGLYSGLYYSKNGHIFVSSCDLPFPNQNLIRLICSSREGYDAVIPATAEGEEPLFALYSTSCLPAMRAALEGGNYRIRSLFDQFRIRILAPKELADADIDGNALINLNTPQDYQQCIRGAA